MTRKIHSWIGIVVFPLVFLAGFTGFYLNHSDTLFGFLNATEYDESQFENWPNAKQADITSSIELADKVWPGVAIDRITSQAYHGRPSYQVVTPRGLLIISKATSHYFVKSSFRRQTFSPSGKLLHSKIYWGYLFESLHARGWPSNFFGTLLTDISSLALIIFSISGVVLWWLPKANKARRTIAGLRHAAPNKPQLEL